MSDQHPARIGLRIAELRKIHGVTQQALAMRAAVSYSLLRKVERGERPASPSFIAAIARALSVSVLDITEQPYGARDAHPTSEQAGVPALRQALAEGDDPELDTSLRSLDDLRAAMADIHELNRKGKYADEVRGLPDLLRHLHATVNACPVNARPGAYEMLSAAYSYATIALYRLGHLDLTHLADERARAAAAHGDDPLRAAVAEWNHSLILMFDGAYPAALRSIDRAEAIVDLAQPSPAVPAVRGALHLRAAVIAARATHSDLAAEHLVAARSLAVDGQDEANFYNTKFGLPNVTIHEVSVPVELADGTTAVTRAAKVTLPAHTAPSRVGHYWIDIARAWLLHGNRARALDSLQQARRITPQLTRYHPQVHETVHILAARDARSTASLRHFAAWCGIRT
ncbi:MAG TPA: helix-turn-helix domain-containing protein [Pseudonocardiaceae bacterium]|jgi:transcriptional regulator with XRE-family HTH domain|nr:helix-turn-helix domain-containing protein [Pseudonocardiaceae bacterium]